MKSPDLSALRALLDTGAASDRAFVDANIRLAFARGEDARTRAELERLQADVQAAALAAHAGLRARIAAHDVEPHALRQSFDALPAAERDHFVEEVLGIAYPPLEEAKYLPSQIGYMPSGYDELTRVFDVTGLGPGDAFLDIGSGLGKAVLLARLLTGASSRGLELDGTLALRARTACKALGLGDVSCEHGDAEQLSFRGEDVVYLYLPFTGAALHGALRRVLKRDGVAPAPRYLCTAALEPSRYPELRLCAEPKSWLCIYAVDSMLGTP